MIPAIPDNSFRITLELTEREPRLDSVLMKAFRNQGQNLKLQSLSRAEFKTLFKEKRILIKNQPACATSGISSGTTYVDILGV